MCEAEPFYNVFVHILFVGESRDSLDNCAQEGKAKVGIFPLRSGEIAHCARCHMLLYLCKVRKLEVVPVVSIAIALETGSMRQQVTYSNPGGCWRVRGGTPGQVMLHILIYMQFSLLEQLQNGDRSEYLRERCDPVARGIGSFSLLLYIRISVAPTEEHLIFIYYA